MKDQTARRTLVVPCRFGDKAGQFRVHLGSPARGFDVLYFQAAWLRETFGGEIEPKVLAALGGRDEDPGP